VNRCYSCKEEKWPSDFPINRTRPDGLGTMCKACKKVYNVAYYADTKERRNPGRAERRQRVRREAREHVFAYLGEHPCVDCGETDIVVLDFDHQGDKTHEINAMIHAGRSWGEILAEIEKCEVVCSNDHRRRTAKAFRWYRAEMTSSPVSLTAKSSGLLIREVWVRIPDGVPQPGFEPRAAHAGVMASWQTWPPQERPLARSTRVSRTRCHFVQRAGHRTLIPAIKVRILEWQRGRRARLRLRLRTADGPGRHRVAALLRSCRKQVDGHG
jgi:hypothetical protein